MIRISIEKDGEEIGIVKGETVVDAVNRLILMFDLRDMKKGGDCKR